MSRIPKIIHYVWLGRGEKPQLVTDCMKTWEKLGYEIKEWNEDNFDINYNKFAKKVMTLKSMLSQVTLYVYTRCITKAGCI